MPPFLSCLLILFVNPSCYLFSGSHVLEWNVRLIVSDNVEMENSRRLNNATFLALPHCNYVLHVSCYYVFTCQIKRYNDFIFTFGSKLLLFGRPNH